MQNSLLGEMILNNARLQTIKPTKSYNYMVEAFKTALKEIKIELDDEVAGRFVEKQSRINL